MSALDKLNPAQRRAVEYPDGPVLVLAGPGTGKTGVLVERILHLLETRGVEPYRILALTFSRRAAEEMERRLARSELASRVNVRTFHSFALRVVKRHYTAVGFSAPPMIISTTRQWELVREILQTENPTAWNLAPEAFSSRATVKEIYDLLLRARENSCGPRELERLGKRYELGYLRRAGHVLEEYQRRLNAASEVDYEQVVQLTLRLLRDGHEEVSGRYDHVLVDEFQDTNRSQLDLVKLLMPSDRPNVFCVGDDAQSIYGFRGARADNVRDFDKKHFPGAEVIQLSTNYRSAQPVVTLAEAALAVDDIARERDTQELPQVRGGSVVRQVRPTDREEGDWIADRILELHASGVAFDKIAILRRSLLDAEPLIESLRSRGIPVDFSNTPARTSAGRFAILFQAAAGEDPSPKQASRALISPLAGLSADSARALRVTAQSASLSVFEMIRGESFPPSVPEEERDRAVAVVRAVDAAREIPDFLRKLDHLWKNLPGTRRLFNVHAKDAEAARAIADTGAFMRAAISYARAIVSSGEGRTPDVASFIASGDPLDEDSDTWAPTVPPVEGAVRVMTVHASKGLEFEAIFVSGLTQGRFPVASRGVRFVDAGLLAGRGPTSKQDLEASHLREERRLFYVALTRACTYLYLTGVAEAAEDGPEVSQFLTELEPFLATLAAERATRHFWVSRDEAVAALRRLACDLSGTTVLPERFAACRALAEMDERPEDGPSPWWRYVRPSDERRATPLATELRDREVVGLSRCPRRAFFTDLTRRGGRSAAGGSRYRGAYFGALLARGFETFLGGEHESLRAVLREEVEAANFAGPAFRAHWLREVDGLDPSCDVWARSIRSSLVSGSGAWTLEIGGHRICGDHGPVTSVEGVRVMNRISSSKDPLSLKEAETDVETALQTLGVEAERGEVHYPRHLARGRPNRRVQGDYDGWRDELEARLHALFADLDAGEYRPNPDDGRCESCAFITVCPAYAHDPSWLDTGASAKRGVGA